MASIQFNLDFNETEGTVFTITRTADGFVIGQETSPTALSVDVPDSEAVEADEEVVDDAVLAEIFGRWADENPDSGAFELVRQLRKKGIPIVAPKIRKADKKKVEPYVRLLTKSSSGITVAAYINTASMIVSRQKLKATAAEAPGADVHGNGDVYFDVDNVNGCLDVVDLLLAL